MIYLDYSATTPVNKEVLDSYVTANLEFVGNANSMHELGLKITKLINSATKQIADILHVKEQEIIYTSGSSEANNLAIKGLCYKYQNRGKHIITTNFEHSSINETLEFLKNNGYEISYVDCDNNGIVKLDSLKKLIRNDTILVIVTAVNSEIGIVEPIEEIGKFLKDYPKCFFMSDLTQSIGKININLDNVDLATFSAHKIYGLKGIGCLVKKEKVLLEPLIHGGKSTTRYRSGTPAHPLIASLAKALRLAVENLDEKYNHVLKLNIYLKEKLNSYQDVYINSNSCCVPHILNVSIIGIKSETFMHALEKENIFISTKTACNDDNTMSMAVYNLTHDKDKSLSSIRISISYLTTKEEIDNFLKAFDKCYHELKLI